ncbi:MAG TPA: hypothetical protein VE263_05740 [Candidatus Angelobacter sp.]|nr:hypothetical protein [Candidatus Angelobacter sp.]
MRKGMLAGFLAFAYVLPESAGAEELKQETTEAFNQYVRMTEDRMTRSAAAAFGTYYVVQQISMRFFLIAPSPAAMQNEGNSPITPYITRRTLCTLRES